MAETERCAGTCRNIENALVELMRERRYRDITASAIAEKAGISRQGFYLHFKDKDDVLVGFIQRLFGELMTAAQEQNALTNLELVTTYTAEVRKHADLLRLLADNDLDGHLRTAFLRELTSRPPVFPCQLENIGAEEWRYFHSFWVSAFIAVYMQWLSDGMTTPEEELNRILTNIMAGAYFLN